MMKLVLLLACVLLSFQQVEAQQFSNVTVKDCSGSNHDLYQELDGGKIVVLCWVMPCGSCIIPASTSYNVVKSFQAATPNRVYFYLMDDYANTNCNSLNTWANAYNMTASNFSVRMSDASMKMTDFGEEGMPKIVLIAGNEHKILYHSENNVDATALQSAIRQQLELSTSVETESSSLQDLYISPNPAHEMLHISFTAHASSLVEIELHDLFGRLVQSSTSQLKGLTKNEFDLNISSLSSGAYVLRVRDGLTTTVSQIVVQH